MNANQIRQKEDLQEPVASTRHLTLITPSPEGSSAEDSRKGGMESIPLSVILIALGFALYFSAIFGLYILWVH